jgi:hypothetical protein
MENYEQIKSDLEAAKATSNEKVIVQYDAWTTVVRWPVLGLSTVTDLAVYANDAEGEVAVKGLFGGDGLAKLRDLFEGLVNNPIALALLRARFKI